jgi:hypothetical protein
VKQLCVALHSDDWPRGTESASDIIQASLLTIHVTRSAAPGADDDQVPESRALAVRRSAALLCGW